MTANTYNTILHIFEFTQGKEFRYSILHDIVTMWGMSYSTFRKYVNIEKRTETIYIRYSVEDLVELLNNGPCYNGEEEFKVIDGQAYAVEERCYYKVIGFKE